MTQNKLEKLKSKLADAEKKRVQLDKTIKRLQSQISEEETKSFRMTLTELDLSVEEAISFLKEKNRPSAAQLAHSFNQAALPSDSQNTEGKELKNNV
ncbi:hypothetical protein HMPREF9498_01419 (plasmid) [Enterococcus mundtii QU 25]|uniref:hypothetical protein n=1 Tax=Enterococcus mundtii TaxID=53346 RepID=UPI0003C53AD1|nr:hypothetical protein [Enterococcus mundtii]BAO08511.1 hypothetical protein HMPREF9498_01419 [Enterococcus mundtii QU 25]